MVRDIIRFEMLSIANTNLTYIRHKISGPYFSINLLDNYYSLNGRVTLQCNTITRNRRPRALL